MSRGWPPENKIGLSAFDLAFGAIDGAFTFNSFGFANEVDTTDPPVDVWNGFHLHNLNQYTFSSSADIDTISSSNALDVGQSIIVTGLDADWKWSSQIAVTNGQNKVTLGTPLIRVNRITNFSILGMAGNCYVYVDGAITGGIPDVKGDIRSIINNGENGSEQAIFSTPSDFDTYLLKTSHNVGGDFNQGHKVEITNRFTPFGGSPILAGRFEVNTEGNGNVIRDEAVPVPFAPKSDFVACVTEVSVNDSDINSSYDFQLIPNPPL